MKNFIRGIPFMDINSRLRRGYKVYNETLYIVGALD